MRRLCGRNSNDDQLILNGGGISSSANAYRSDQVQDREETSLSVHAATTRGIGGISPAASNAPMTPLSAKAPKSESMKERDARLNLIRAAQVFIQQGITPGGRAQLALEGATPEDLTAVEELRANQRALELGMSA